MARDTVPLLQTEDRLLAQGPGWRVREVTCRAGPGTPLFEERHAWTGVAVVASGTFSYRSTAGRADLVPGALLLANDGACFECGHQHGVGDRCISFQYSPELASLAFPRTVHFAAVAVPPLDQTLALTAEAVTGHVDSDGWGDLALRVLDSAVEHAASAPLRQRTDRAVANAVARLVTALDAEPERNWSLQAMAAATGLDAFRLIRQFRQSTGTTPYRYLLRQRMVRAAEGLARGSASVQSIALDSGFNDLSEFNRRFRRLFGVTPSAFRQRMRKSGSPFRRPCQRAR